MASILEWFAIRSSSGSRFVKSLHYDLSILGGSAWHGSQLHWVIQATSPQGSGHEGVAWRAAVLGSQRVGHDVVTEQQQIYVYK